MAPLKFAVLDGWKQELKFDEATVGRLQAMVDARNTATHVTLDSEGLANAKTLFKSMPAASSLAPYQAALVAIGAAL